MDFTGAALTEDIAIIEKFFKNEGIRYVIVAGAEVMKASKGKCNPRTAQAIQPLGTSVFLFNIYEAVHWVEQNGMKRC